MDLAAIRGDRELWSFLEGRGEKLPDRPLICKWRLGNGHGGARVVITNGVAAVVALAPDQTPEVGMAPRNTCQGSNR